MSSPLQVRVEEMLVRKRIGDDLAAFALAESILAQLPVHGLASACWVECARKLRTLFESIPLVRGLRTDLDPVARQLLARIDGRKTVASILPARPERASGLRALHELLRLGLI
jgi:hypothetical protein